MKATILIKEGRKQLVLEPETDFDKEALKMFPKDEPKVNPLDLKPKEEPRGNIKFYRGTFYECQGGWTREGGRAESLILVIDDEE